MDGLTLGRVIGLICQAESDTAIGAGGAGGGHIVMRAIDHAVLIVEDWIIGAEAGSKQPAADGFVIEESSDAAAQWILEPIVSIVIRECKQAASEVELRDERAAGTQIGEEDGVKRRARREL